MHIMFVCTGNICRSPMGELLLTRYLSGTTVQVSARVRMACPCIRLIPTAPCLWKA